MLLTVALLSVPLAAIAVKAAYENTKLTDYEKIVKILGDDLQLVRKTPQIWGVEYVFTFPLGKTFRDYEAKKGHLEDGLVKEVELSFDGWITLKVYDTPFPSNITYEWTEERNWHIPVGIKRDASPETLNFKDTPHVVLGGGTRYGKSNMLHVVVVSLLRNMPDAVSFTFIDLKGGVELSEYESIRQCRSLSREPEEAVEALRRAYVEMKEAQKVFDKRKPPKMRHFVIIDEVGELNPSEAVTKEEKALKIECQKYMSQLARLGAGLGFHLILATQYPTGDVIPRQCKQNSDAKICFRVQSGIASRVILDEEGAEKLPSIKGRAIFQRGADKYTVQVPLISDGIITDEINKHRVDRPSKEEIHHEESKTISETFEQPPREDTFIIEETWLSD